MEISQVPSGSDVLVVEADFPAVAARTLFDYWTQPELLRQWWPQEAEIEPEAGGAYHLSWPQMNWHLRGRYTVFAPGERLGFTWQWDDSAQEAGEREVVVIFEPMAPDGTRLRLTHGRYAETPEEQELRIEHHLAGWKHFLARLRHVLEARG